MPTAVAAERSLPSRSISVSRAFASIHTYQRIRSIALYRLRWRLCFELGRLMRIRLFNRLAGLACAVALSAPAVGAEAGVLSLENAVQRSLESHPLLGAEAADLRGAQARAQRAGMPPQFVVGSELENFAGTGDLRGMHSSEITLRLGRVFELGGKQEARQALGAAEIDRQQNSAEFIRLELAARTTVRFIEVVAGQERLNFARQQVQLAQRTRREVGNWVRAGRNPESDQAAADIALAEAELEQGNAEHELETAKVLLAAMWGAKTADYQRASGNLTDLPAVATFETLAARLPMSAPHHNAALAARVAAAKRRVAQATLQPDVNASLGVRRVEALDDNALVMSLSIPLGNKPRAALAIEEANAEYEAIVLRREAQLAESHGALFQAYQELMHARTEYEALRGQMIPRAEQALNVSRRGFDAGRFSFLSLAQAQRTLFDLRKRAVAAATRYHILLVDIERLTTVYAEPQS